MTAKSPPVRRPHRSNRPLGLDRSLKALKTIYWTKSTFQKLLRRLVRNDREEWFAARVRALKDWPERTSEQIIDGASRINPRRLMDGRWAWPKREREIQQELLRSAPEDGIDIGALRDLLSKLDNRQGDRLNELLAESEFLKDTTVPLDNGLPQPKEIGTPLLRRIRGVHNYLVAAVAGDSDGALAAARRPEVPRANLGSSIGRVISEC